MVLPEALSEQLMDQHVRVVFVDLDLFEDDAALALDVRRGKGRIQDQVGQNIQGNGDMLSQGLDVEADGFLAGEGVQVAANGIHLTGDQLRGAGAGALEEHVLHEMRDAVGLRWLAAGAGLNPDAHGTERICSMRSVKTIRPLGSTVRRRLRSGVIVISQFDCRPIP